jgi:hypothetical protein
MTLDEFEAWLDQNEEHWRSSDDDIWPDLQEGQAAPNLPDSYRELQQRVGALWLYSYIFLGEKGVADRTDFIHSLSKPNEGITYDHLTAFCCLSSANRYLCFDGERVVAFNSIEANEASAEVAASFPKFLSELVKHNGESFWLKNR